MGGSFDSPLEKENRYWIPPCRLTGRQLTCTKCSGTTTSCEDQAMLMSYKEVDNLGVADFTDLICGSLRLWQYKLNRKVPVGDNERLKLLARITGNDGNINRQPAELQLRNGKTVGKPMTLKCFICKIHLLAGTQKQQTTSWWSQDCKMPICKADRSVQILTCLEEHMQSIAAVLGCITKNTKGTPVSERLHVDLEERRSKRYRPTGEQQQRHCRQIVIRTKLYCIVHCAVLENRHHLHCTKLQMT